MPKCIVHGAGRHAAPAREGAPAALRHPARRSRVLFHDARLDDVELAGLGARLAARRFCCTTDRRFTPTANVLFDFADAHGDDVLRHVREVHRRRSQGRTPSSRDARGSDALRTITSTGSPLLLRASTSSIEHVKRDVHLASISGGTDIVSCFVGGDPTARCGAARSRAARSAWRWTLRRGRSTGRGQKGELVCTLPFPSMPIGFWNDPDGREYRAAYFEQVPGVWSHGDFVEDRARRDHHPRPLDATLNPGGVRIGTAEIYRQVEQLPRSSRAWWSARTGTATSASSCSCGSATARRWTRPSSSGSARPSGRTRLHATCRPRSCGDRHPRDEVGEDRRNVRSRHRPRRQVRNREALANPEALEQFRGREELLD